jgi:hypothetical protein
MRKLVYVTIAAIVVLTIGSIWRTIHVGSVQAQIQNDKNSRVLWKNY